MGDSAKWALIIGGSSGLGLATAQKLASEGFNLILIHRDRRANMPSVQEEFQLMVSNGATVHSFNKDAVDVAGRKEIVEEIKPLLGATKISVLVHSIAKGNVKPMWDAQDGALSSNDFQLTMDAMAISLFDWVKVLHQSQIFGQDVRVIAFTSEGSTRALKNYAAVGAAKAALESITRNIALEFAPFGIKANCIQAGVTDTPSLRLIPNSEKLIQASIRRNPNRRLTTPKDVANVTYLLTTKEAQWITGTVIKVDGGESLQ
ncbi:SDR family oxidoreductase [Flagellimonas flava]|uniref:SDR family oxidoreductase n=1 Tax=Flagellimonas flava TaxID=570519 RepID=UPI003D656482